MDVDDRSAVDAGQVEQLNLLTARDAAALLAVGRTTIYELIAGGELGTVHIGRAMRIPRAELEEFVSRRCRTSPVR